MSNPFSVFELQITEQKNELLRLKGQIDVRDAVISKLSGTVAEWRPLLTRAADALSKESWPSVHHDYSGLISELRKAAQ
jgi:hypothetical protein